MRSDLFTHPNLKIPTAIACGLGLAVGLAVAAGRGDFRQVGLVLGGIAVAGYLLFFQQHTWKVALFFCLAQLMHFGFGFALGELEFSLLFGGSIFATTWWHKQVMEKPPALRHWSFGWFTTITFLWLVYLAGHTFYNIYQPYRPQDFALKNLLRTTEMWAGPLLLAFYFSLRPRGISLRANFPQVICRLLLAGLWINIFIRIFQFVTGRAEQPFDPNDPTASADLYFTIPVIGLTENVYALRNLSPLAMLFTGAFTATRWFREQGRGTHRLFYTTMVFSVIGAVLSGGRATLASTLGLLVITLILRRRIGLLLAALGAFVLLISAVNIVPDLVKNAPSMMRRSLNWALIERDYEASSSISGSTAWRYELFQRALSEWQSDPRIFWFGRATYSYGQKDMMAVMLLGEEGKLQSALRRGATHNMITDLLIAFGLCGLVLYTALVGSFLGLLWRLYRSETIGEVARTLALIIFLLSGYTFATGLLGGGNFSITAVWLFILLIAWLYREHRLRLEEDKPTGVIAQPANRALHRTPPRRPSLPTRF
jgi:O-antigen ligase